MIESQLFILEQAKKYLMSVSKKQYIQIISPSFISSAGVHMRHILDHYHAVINGIESGRIDYDQRDRGGNIEVSPNAALQAIDAIITFLKKVTIGQQLKMIELSTEVSLQHKEVAVVKTTVAREIIFVGTHAIHHLASIKLIAQAQKITVDAELGVAPATASFLRSGKV